MTKFSMTTNNNKNHVESAETALSFHEYDLKSYKEHRKDKKTEVEKESEPICIFVAVDDKNLPNSNIPNSFQFENFLFNVTQHSENGVKRVFLQVSAVNKESEWSLLVQLRIKTGTEASVLNVVDKDVFKFDAFSYPLNVEVQTNDVKFLKFEMRVLNMMYLELPKFQDGDEIIEFDDGGRIHIHANILGLLSDYMASNEKLASQKKEDRVIKVTSTEKEAFLELLYQVYPTRRPIFASFRRLAAAAVGYRCTELIFHLSKHLLEYNYRPMSFLQRFQAAIENRLEPAIRELAFQASLNGTWNQMIQNGFEPENFCGKDVYTKIVCPAILSARNASLDSTTMVDPKKAVNFLELENGDTTKSTILFRGTKFYINSGLLAAHGTSMFFVSKEGEFVAIYSPQFQRECVRENLLPGEVLLQLLSYMMPFGLLPHSKMIRACIAFCYDHGWDVMKENLEQEMEPPILADEYMSQLIFAEKFRLQNLIRVNVQRAESSCRELAEVLEREGVLRRLSERTYEGIMDRMCSGWGLNPLVNRLATRLPTTFNNRMVNLHRGKAVVVGEGRAIDTLNSIQSDYAFGELNELQVIE